MVDCFVIWVHLWGTNCNIIPEYQASRWMDKLVPHWESETSAPGKEESWPHFSSYSSSRSLGLMIVCWCESTLTYLVPVRHIPWLNYQRGSGNRMSQNLCKFCILWLWYLCMADRPLSLEQIFHYLGENKCKFMCIVQKRLWQIQGVLLKPITDYWDLGYIKGYSAL